MWNFFISQILLAFWALGKYWKDKSRAKPKVVSGGWLNLFLKRWAKMKVLALFLGQWTWADKPIKNNLIQLEYFYSWHWELQNWIFSVKINFLGAMSCLLFWDTNRWIKQKTLLKWIPRMRTFFGKKIWKLFLSSREYINVCNSVWSISLALVQSKHQP